jgi:ethanolamine utilization protein EutP
MAVEYFGRFVNTPGEFLENRRFYHALITSAADCDTLFFVQDTTRNSCLFPPLFASMFNRKIIGILSKIDKEKSNSTLATRFLENAGVKEIIATSVIAGDGLDRLQLLISNTAVTSQQ